jgi:hypothetical protein
MCSPHRESRGRVGRLLTSLKVGAKTNLNLSSGKTFSYDVPANRVALYLHDLAKALRRAPIDQWDVYEGLLLGQVGRFSYSASHKAGAVSSDAEQLSAIEMWGQEGVGSILPPLSKSTASQWAVAMPELFKIVYGEKFDEHPLLQELKRSVSARAKTVYGKAGGPGILRKMMLQAVKQAFRSIAALD